MATALPLPLRNALATLAIAALDDDDAAAALAWCAGGGRPGDAAARRLAAVHLVDPGGDALVDVHRPHADAIHAHAVRALRAAAAHRSAPPARQEAVARAVSAAAALWGERLFFEVHEVLEAVWKDAVGDVRQALQGVIQIAVAFHHLAHGNVRGARTLMREGRARVGAAPRALPSLDADALLAATAPWDDALAAGTAPPAVVPSLPLR